MTEKLLTTDSRGQGRGLSKSEETRSRILNTAVELFRKDGFEQTTMRQIAAECQMALGAAYYYFPSKDALVMSFYERAQMDLEPILLEALSRHKDLQSRLRALIEVKLRYFQPDRTEPAGHFVSAHRSLTPPFAVQQRNAAHSQPRYTRVRSPARGPGGSGTAGPPPAPAAYLVALSNGLAALLGVWPFAGADQNEATARRKSRHYRSTEQARGSAIFAGRAQTSGQPSGDNVRTRSKIGFDCEGVMKTIVLADSWARASLLFYRLVAIVFESFQGPPSVDSRRETLPWDGRTLGGWCDALEGAAAVINLVGRSVNCRYTAKNRREIVDSRVNSVRVLGEAIARCRRPLSTLVQASSLAVVCTEQKPPGSGFGAEVCLQWEAAVNSLKLPETRLAVLRIGFALGRAGGVPGHLPASQSGSWAEAQGPAHSTSVGFISTI
jgi:AcrR family transcriptional regulator